MPIHLLPEEIWGMDTDDIFAYSTPKIALIRDRYVGFLYYMLVSLAMCWVLIGQVLWRNEHFMLKDVKGTPRMFISHPTLNQCDPNEAACMADFKPMSDLPYCVEHRAGGSEVPHPAHCAFSDKHSMFVDGTVGSQVFIPTAVVVIEEKQRCLPSATNKFSCDNEYQQEDEGYYFNETQMTYYANIEDYTVQFTSTYHREDIFGTSLDHPGYVAECHDKNKSALGKELTWQERLDKRRACQDERLVAVECMAGIGCDKGGLETIELKDKFKEDLEKNLDKLDENANIPAIKGSSLLGLSHRHHHHSHRALRRARGDEETDQTPKDTKDKEEEALHRPTPDFFSSTWGDSFKVGKLMQLANVDLDRHYNMDHLTARMAGTVIEVEATYSNLRRFMSSLGLSQVKYNYRVRERSLPYVSKESLHPNQPEDFPKHRRYLVQHGILLDFKVGGEFGFFSVVYLLIMLTTSLALLAGAAKAADLISLYIHPRKRNYFHHKYDVSGDFSDMWKCPKCGYYNLAPQECCQGLDKWESAHDERTEHCGQPRPAGHTPAHGSKA